MDGYGTNRSTGQASNDQNNQRRNSELGENVLGQIWHWMMNSHQNSDYGDTERDLESAERAEREREREREREEQRKRVQELDARIAAENDESEKAMAKHKEEMQNKKATMVRQNTERRLKIKKENEKHQQFLQKQAQERAIKEEEAEKEHQQKLKENEEDRIKEIEALQRQLEEMEQKKQERINKANAEKERFQELSQTRMAELEKQKKELEEEIQQMKVNQEQSSKEWEANLHIKLNNVQEEFLKEIANRKEQEEAQISNLKLINEESEQKSISLAKSLTELQTVVKEKKREMNETRRDSQAINSKQGNIQQDSVSNQPIKLVENQMLGTIDVIIENTNDSKNIAVIGLPKTGRSTLVGALAGGIWPKNLSQNPVNTKYGKIYKLNYPNNGFIDGSVNENRPIYEKFFQNAKLSNLSTLIITIDGSVREEDYLVLSLAQKYCIPTVIARTKLDEWLDNRPKDQSKEDYVKDDKKFVIESLQKLGINFSQNNIFNISALSTIIIAEEGSQSDMFKYLQDDDALLETLNKLIASPRNSHRNVPAQRTEQRNIALAILESQIEAEKLRTEEAKAEQARIQSLAASAERRTSIRKDKSTNEMPRSPYQLQSFGNQKNKQNTVVDADIVVLGMKDSGKSGIIEALRQSLNWSKRDKIIVEIGYDETMSRDYVISMIDRSNPKLYILIISNTIGRLDAEVARYVINSKKRLCVSLNKSDEIIYNLEKQHSFYGNQDYTRKRLEAANNEFKKVNIFNLPCFTTSALVLAGILNNTYATQEREFLTFVETNLKNM